MTVNMTKVLASAVIAIALLIVIVRVDDAAAWAVPLLGILIGYVGGNAQFTSREGNTAPIVSSRG